MTGDEPKKGNDFSVKVSLKRDLTKEEADHLSKVLDLAASSMRLHLEGSVVTVQDNKPKAK